MDGDARLEFRSKQISEEEFLVQDPEGNDMFGQEFMPRIPSEARGGVCHLLGSFVDAFSYRDVHHVEIEIETPSKGTIYLDEPDIATNDGERVKFDLNWTFADHLEGEEDAGMYVVNFTIVDMNENSFEYHEALRFIISKYGVFLRIPENGTDEISANAGESVSFHLDLLHAGLVAEDTFEMVFPELPGGWEVVTDPETLELAEGEWDGIKITVSIPGDAEVGDSVEIRVTAESMGSQEDEEYNRADWSIRITVRVSAKGNFSLFYKEEDSSRDNSEYIDSTHKHGTAGRGQTVDFIFRIRNDSPAADTIALKLSGIPHDWDAEIIDPESDSRAEEEGSL